MNKLLLAFLILLIGCSQVIKPINPDFDKCRVHPYITFGDTCGMTWIISIDNLKLNTLRFSGEYIYDNEEMLICIKTDEPYQIDNLLTDNQTTEIVKQALECKNKKESAHLDIWEAEITFHNTTQGCFFVNDSQNKGDFVRVEISSHHFSRKYSDLEYKEGEYPSEPFWYLDNDVICELR